MIIYYAPKPLTAGVSSNTLTTVIVERNFASSWHGTD